MGWWWWCERILGIADTFPAAHARNSEFCILRAYIATESITFSYNNFRDKLSKLFVNNDSRITLNRKTEPDNSRFTSNK